MGIIQEAVGTARGYAIVRDGDGRVVRLAQAVAPGDTLNIQVVDGEVTAVVASDKSNLQEDVTMG